MTEQDLQTIREILQRNSTDGYILIVHTKEAQEADKCRTILHAKDDEDGHLYDRALDDIITEVGLDRAPPELSQPLLVLIAGAAMNAQAGTRGYKKRLALAAAAQACIDDMQLPDRIDTALDVTREAIVNFVPDGPMREMTLEQVDRTMKQVRSFLLHEEMPEPAVASEPPTQQPEWAAEMQRQFEEEEAARKAAEADIARREKEEAPRALPYVPPDLRDGQGLTGPHCDPNDDYD